jgi:hypothetical protein
MLTNLSDSDLVQYWANAARTAWGGIGHGKRQRNQDCVEKYESEMIRRGIPVPKDEQIKSCGVFNGPGSA